MKLETAGYRPITLGHDEVIAEPKVGFGSIDEMCSIMAEMPDWGSGFFFFG